MSRLLHYGPHKIRVKDDSDLTPLLDRIEEAANSGKAQWVEISAEGDAHRILIQPGIPIYVEGKGTSAQVFI